MGKKFISQSFLSTLGRHSPISIGKDIGYGELKKIGEALGNNKGNLKTQDFVDAARVVTNHGKLIDLGIKVGTHLVVKAVENGAFSLVNNGISKSPLVSSSSSSPIGKNNVRIYRTKVHLGKKTSRRLRNMRNLPNVDYVEKLLASSMKDYQSHDKRVNLTVTSGFNRKGFAFLAEDTFLSVKDYSLLYSGKNINEIDLENNLEKIKRKKRRTDAYTCSYNTQNKFVFRNLLKYYNLNLKVHLLKIKDPNDDLRGIVAKITNNNAEKSLISTDDRWKIKEEDQYTDPLISDLKNRITLSFETSLSCQLADSKSFKDRVTVVDSWFRQIEPGSIWNFSLKHHLGGGVDLEYLEEMTDKNKEHPSGYVFLLEFLGDPRGRIIRNEDGDSFNGYSPSRIEIEFEHKYSFLYETNEKEEEIPATYGNKKSQEDFDEGTDFEKIFTPDRTSSFNVDTKDIKFDFPSKNKKPKFNLDYNLDILGSAGMHNTTINYIEKEFKAEGTTGDNITEDDIRYVIKNKGLRGVVDTYIGPDTPPPPLEEEIDPEDDEKIINLD
jgi:hypothetical protein